MAERINISIPEDLSARLSCFKDRLNVSKICQEAISHAVRIEEIKEEGALDMQKLIARLKEEKQQYGKKFIEEGYQYGLQDAYKTSLDDFLWIHNIWDGLGDTYSEIFEDYASDKSKEYIAKLEEDIMEDDEKKDQFGWGLTVMLDVKHFFAEGWFKGLFSVWEQIQPSLMKEEGPCDL